MQRGPLCWGEVHLVVASLPPSSGADRSHRKTVRGGIESMHKLFGGSGIPRPVCPRPPFSSDDPERVLGCSTGPAV